MTKVLKETKKKYFDTRTKDGKPVVNPQNYAFHDINKGEFANEQRSTFFDEAFGEILYDYFTKWLETSADQHEQREHLYCAAMGLGSVKQKLREYETLGKNTALLEKQKNEED